MYSMLLPLEVNDPRQVSEVPVPFSGTSHGAWGDLCDAVRRIVERVRVGARPATNTIEPR